MEKINRREFLRGAGAGAFALFASRLEAQESERNPEDLLYDIESLTKSLSGLDEEMIRLGLAYGDYFKNDNLDQLGEEGKQLYASFLERAETAWNQALALQEEIQTLTAGTSINEYEQYGLGDHINARILRSFADLKPSLLGLLLLRMNIAREALGIEIVEYGSPFDAE